MNQALLEKSIKMIQDPDLIVNMYEHTIVWASEKCFEITGKKKTEVLGKIVYDFEDLPADKAKLLTTKAIMSLEGESEYPVVTNKGTVILKFKYKIFEFETQHFFVGKIISVTPQ
jgi:hypothetical protein